MGARVLAGTCFFYDVSNLFLVFEKLELSDYRLCTYLLSLTIFSMECYHSIIFFLFKQFYLLKIVL